MYKFNLKQFYITKICFNIRTNKKKPLNNQASLCLSCVIWRVESFNAINISILKEKCFMKESL